MQLIDISYFMANLSCIRAARNVRIVPRAPARRTYALVRQARIGVVLSLPVLVWIAGNGVRSVYPPGALPTGNDIIFLEHC